MWKSESRHFQLDVHVAVPVLLQHALGVDSSVDSVRQLQVCHRRSGWAEQTERSEKACLVGGIQVQLFAVPGEMRQITCVQLHSRAIEDKLRSEQDWLYDLSFV